jgi:non-heme chloroperoxidase
VNLLAHFLGCAVVWCYLDMFGPERIAKLIFVDQSPFLTANPAWSKSERAAAESALTPAERLDPISVYEIANLDQAVANLSAPNGDAMRRQFLGSLFTEKMPEKEKAWALDMMLKLPHASSTTTPRRTGSTWSRASRCRP